MGIIRAITQAIGGGLADQWLEVYEADDMGDNTVFTSGVHVGQDDMEAGEVRKRLGEDKIIGVSAHSVEEALRAEKCGATYLGSGAVFGSGTKKDVGTLDHEVLKEICAAVQIPVVAIGGISRDNILQLKGTGIDGVAVISAIFAQKDIRAAAQELRKLSEEVCR